MHVKRVQYKVVSYSLAYSGGGLKKLWKLNAVTSITDNWMQIFVYCYINQLDPGGKQCGARTWRLLFDAKQAFERPRHVDKKDINRAGAILVMVSGGLLCPSRQWSCDKVYGRYRTIFLFMSFVGIIKIGYLLLNRRRAGRTQFPTEKCVVFLMYFFADHYEFCVISKWAIYHFSVSHGKQ